MAAPVSYNNTTTELPPVPKHIDDVPDRAQVMKTFAHGGMRFVMGKHDTATSLFKTLYGNDRYVEGGASHLQAHLAGRPGGYPKPGDVVEIPNFNDYVGKAKPAALERAIELIERQEAGRCKEHTSRQADGSARMAAVIAPRATRYAGIGFGGQGHRTFAASALPYGRRW